MNGPPERRSRPAGNGPADVVEAAKHDGTVSVPRPPVYDDPAREAAFRRHQQVLRNAPYLPQEIQRMRSRRPKLPPRLRITVVTERTAVVEGTHVLRVLTRAGAPRQYGRSPGVGDEEHLVWMVPTWAVADICAAAESLGGSVEGDSQVPLWDEAS